MLTGLTTGAKAVITEDKQQVLIVYSILIVWEYIALPFICERIIAFSIPENDALWILSWDYLFQVTLALEVCVSIAFKEEEILEEFDEDRSVLTLNGYVYPMLGLWGGVPILRNKLGDGLSLEPQQDRLVILSCNNQIKQIIEFSDPSGDWRWATFSTDSRYLVIGVPDCLFVYSYH